MVQPPRLDIQLMGRFRVRIGARELSSTDFPARRAVELVQLLVLSRDHRLVRDQVADALWPHLDASAAFANLRKAAHHARRALGDSRAIVLEGGVVALAPECSLDIDVERFDASARHALAHRDARRAAEASDLYTGDLLPEAPYAGWTEEPRSRLRRQQAELLRLAGRWERLVELEPLDEPAHCALMRAALKDGNRPSAIRCYARLRTVLRAELGVEPGDEATALYRQAVAGLEPETPLLVGRDVELSRATAYLRSVPKARRPVVVVRGPAGMGKTALCDEVATLARDDGWRVIRAIADDPSEAYALLAVLIDALARESPGCFDALPEPARAVLGALGASGLAGDALVGPVTRHRVIGAFRRLVEHCQANARLMLIVDDAHLVDAATSEVLANLGGAESGSPPLMIAIRSEPVTKAFARALSRIERAGNVLEIDLGPLTDADARTLAASAMPEGASPEALARIVSLADGNPFLLRELARHGGAADLRPNGWSAIRERFLTVPRGMIEMLKRLALAGDAFDTSEVLALTGLPEPEALRVLDAALRAGALVVADVRYRFCHALVRRSLVESLPPHQRIAIHRDTARRLAALGGSASRIARHWLDGDRPKDAVPWLLVAARRAVRLGAFANALGELDLLLEHAPEDIEALVMRADVLDTMGDPRALTAYAAAVAHAGAEVAREIRPKQALALLKAGDPDAALRTLEGDEPVTTDGLLAKALTVSGASAIGYGDANAAAACAAEARRLGMASGRADAAVEAAWAESLAAHAQGKLTARLQADLAATHSLPELAARVFDGHLCATERLLYGARPYRDVIDFATALAHEAERLGAARGRAFALTLRGEARLLSGHLVDAARDLERGAELHEQIGAAAGQALSLQRRAEVALYEGRRTEALAYLARALGRARESFPAAG